MQLLNRRTHLSVLVFMFSFLAVACGDQGSPPTATEQTTEAQSTESEVEESIEETEPVVVTSYGFGQAEAGGSVGFGFMVENPNDLAILESEYEISAFDENDVLVGTYESHLIDLLPGQSLGVGGNFSVDGDVTVSKIEVQLTSGYPEADVTLPTFTVESVTFYPGERWSAATGVIKNPNDTNFPDILIYAIALDEAGNIVGGGVDDATPFVLANGSTGTETRVYSAGDVASVELYPVVSSWSSTVEELPGDASEIQLVKYGFGQTDQRAGFGMLLENPNSNYALQYVKYRVIAYAADGAVLSVTGTKEIPWLFPEQTLGIGDDLFLASEGGEMDIDHIEVQVLAGEYVETGVIPFLTTEKVSYRTGDEFEPYLWFARGLVVNPYDTSVSDFTVYAIAYDADGEIIGGGYDYPFDKELPANGSLEYVVGIDASGNLYRVELYATVGYSFELE